eukprot:GEZU01005039.1.p1 GENE.GEZU01005039.1~~GEZU01005039.1.p1  ORF type:complete len:335 (-),score=54.73 GEZU01005039.1:26-1030(-)
MISGFFRTLCVLVQFRYQTIQNDLKNMDSSTRLDVLLVSDIHVGLSQVHSMMDWLIDNKKNRLDCILVAGDIADLPSKDIGKAEKEAASEGDASAVLTALENIHPKVYYIPGNHDPHSLFDSDIGGTPPQLTPLSKNIHGAVISLAPGLYIAGLGGSVDSFKEEDPKGYPYWKGFPYPTEAMIKDQLDQLDDRLHAAVNEHLADIGDPSLTSDQDEGNNNTNNRNRCVILMTHCGPAGCSTALYEDEKRLRILMGSSAVRELLESSFMQQHVFLNIHGHTHPGFGVSKVGRVQVLNPGSLKENRFALLRLRKSSGIANSGSWALESVEFVCLPE